MYRLRGKVSTQPFWKHYVVGLLRRSFQSVCSVQVRKDTSTATIKYLTEKNFDTFSVPEATVSNNAPVFISQDFRNLCFQPGIKHVTISPYYLQPSHAERFNRNLKAALIAYHSASHTLWNEDLIWFQVGL